MQLKMFKKGLLHHPSPYLAFPHPPPQASLVSTPTIQSSFIHSLSYLNQVPQLVLQSMLTTHALATAILS